MKKYELKNILKIDKNGKLRTDEEIEEIMEMMVRTASNYSITNKLENLLFALSSTELKELGIDLATIKPDWDEKMPELNDEFLLQFKEYMAQSSSLIDYTLEGTIVKLRKFKPFSCEFISSGKVILENDLREYFKHCDFDINSRTGIIQTMDHYQKQGMLHGFVGNSCPTFWMNEAGDEIAIGSKMKTVIDENGEEDYEDDMEGYTEWGWVCTDLWWYSLVDYEVFKGLSKLTDEAIERDYTVLDLEAGEWKLEHYYGITKHDHGEIYGKLTKIE